MRPVRRARFTRREKPSIGRARARRGVGTPRSTGPFRYQVREVAHLRASALASADYVSTGANFSEGALHSRCITRGQRVRGVA